LMPRSPTKNPFLIPGVTRYSRTVAYKRRHSWLKKNAKTWKTAPKKDETKKPKEKTFGKTTRVIQKKTAKFYPEEPVPHRLHSNKHKHRPTRLRKSIKPGNVLILLAGRFRGSRVVFLKQLKSGLLLVNGPFKTNGVPLRRVNQAYVIATSTRVDIKDIKLDEKFNDKYFQARPQKKKPAEKKPADKKKDKEAKKDKKEKKEKQEKKKEPVKKEKRVKVEPSRIADQKAVDALLVPKIKKVPLLKKYLRTKFSLKKGQYPHLLKF